MSSYIEREHYGNIDTSTVSECSNNTTTTNNNSSNIGGSTPVHKFTLTNECGARVCVTDYGARVLSVHVPDGHGHLRDVALGYESLAAYKADPFYMGCTVGRVAGRIAQASFPLPSSYPRSTVHAETKKEVETISEDQDLEDGGCECRLDVNCGVHHLHGGHCGFDKRVWRWHADSGTKDAGTEATEGADAEGAGVTFSLLSPHGAGGYPGTVLCHATYRLARKTNTLSVTYTALVDHLTPLNLANHTYWNLAGHDSGAHALRRHFVQMSADSRLVCTADCMVTGAVAPVAGTEFHLNGSVDLASSMPRWSLSADDQQDQDQDQERTTKQTKKQDKDTSQTQTLDDDAMCTETDTEMKKQEEVKEQSEKRGEVSSLNTALTKTQSGDEEDDDEDYEQRGFDHYYCWRDADARQKHTSSVNGHQMAQTACVVSPDSRIRLTVHTNQPGVQFYTANFLQCPPEGAAAAVVIGKDSATYRRHSGLCLETQGYPNAVRMRHFPSVFVAPGQLYRHRTVYHFDTVTDSDIRKQLSTT